MAAPKTKADKGTAAKKPATRGKKVTSRAVAKSKPKAVAKIAKTVKKPKAPRRVTAEERHGLISEAAFLRAKRREPWDGDPTQDWLEAEKEVDRQLRGNA